MRSIIQFLLLAIISVVIYSALTTVTPESPEIGTSERPEIVTPESPEIGTPNLVIKNNVIEDNGFGVYVGWHGEWVSEISGNLIVNNGEGIRIVNKAATIFDNVIRDNITGVRVTSTHHGEEVTEVLSVSLFRNVIVGNFAYGLQNLAALTIDARDNWWGSPAGPLLTDDEAVEVVEEETVYETVEAPSQRIFGPIQYTDWRTEAFSPFPHPEDRISPPAKIEPEGATQGEVAEKPGNDETTGEETLVDPQNEPLRDTMEDTRIAAFPERALAFAQHTTAIILPFATLTSADFTGEGNPDLVLAARHSRRIFLQVGDGTGSFDFMANFDSGILVKKLWSADINNDGHFDLILTDGVYEGIVFLLGRGAGIFSLPHYLPTGLVISEVLFTRPDLAAPFDFILLSYQGDRLLAYHVAGDTTFRAGAQINLNRPRSPVLGDFNGDGHPDIAVITDEKEITLLWGREGKRMDAPTVIYTAQQRILDLESGDFNNDGLCDIIFSLAESNTIGLLIGMPQGNFKQSAETGISEGPARLVAIDFDKDGNTDLAAILLQSSQVAILLGRGDGSFLGGSYLFIRNLSSEFYISDFNGDDLPDIVILTTGGNRLSTLLQEG